MLYVTSCNVSPHPVHMYVAVPRHVRRLGVDIRTSSSTKGSAGQRRIGFCGGCAFCRVVGNVQYIHEITPLRFFTVQDIGATKLLVRGQVRIEAVSATIVRSAARVALEQVAPNGLIGHTAAMTRGFGKPVQALQGPHRNGGRRSDIRHIVLVGLILETRRQRRLASQQSLKRGRPHDE
jgi:hypothetical protein